MAGFAHSQTSPLRRKLKLGLIQTGVGGGGGGSANLWRHPDVPIDASVSIDWHIQQAKEAEESLFDFVFITDGLTVDATSPHHHLSHLEPLTLLAAVAVETHHIGLSATVSTTYSEPWDIARRLASLDVISGGRASWNIVTSHNVGSAGNFGSAAHGDHETRYRRATEAVDVVRKLWDSYEDDAFATDKGAERYLDPAKLHPVNHVGEHFSVAGPLNIQRSPQGQPVLIQAGTSEQGRELSARVGELMFSFAKSADWHRALVKDVRDRAVRYARDPADIVFAPALSVLIRDTDEEAWAAERERRASFPLQGQINRLSRTYRGHDFSTYDLDGPFPDLGVAAVISNSEELFSLARAQDWTLRQVLESMHYHHAHFVGSPESIADEIERWYREGDVDGFNVFSREPEEFRRFRLDVVPILQQRGIFRTEYEGTTLRDNLELPVPANRYTTPNSLAA